MRHVGSPSGVDRRATDRRLRQSRRLCCCFRGEALVRSRRRPSTAEAMRTGTSRADASGRRTGYAGAPELGQGRIRGLQMVNEADERRMFSADLSREWLSTPPGNAPIELVYDVLLVTGDPGVDTSG